MRLRSINIGSAAKVSGMLYAGIGLIVGALFSFFSLIGAMAGAAEEGAAFGILFGVGAIVLMPVFYGVLGVLGGAIGAALYNVIAGMVGGIEFELEEIPRRQSWTPPQQPGQP